MHLYNAKRVFNKTRVSNSDNIKFGKTKFKNTVVYEVIYDNEYKQVRLSTIVRF